MVNQGHQKKLGHYFNASRERIRQIEAKALRKLRHPSRARRLKDYIEDIGNEEWATYTGVYDEIRKKNEIVDGIKVESFDFSKKKNEPNSQVQQKQLKEEIVDEVLEEENIESIKKEIDVIENEDFYEEREQLEEDNITTIEEQIQEFEDTEKIGEKLLKEDKQEVEGRIEEETEQYKHSLEEVKNLEEKSKSESYLDEISQLLTELNELDIMLKQTSIEIKGEKSKKQKNKELKAKMKKVENLIQQ